MRWFVLMIAWMGCIDEVEPPPDGEDPTPICDGRLQADEGDVIDAPFDLDGDGFVNGQDLGCVSNYPPEALDCDDEDGNVHPGMPEAPCNGVDDDCDPLTVDAEDLDLDGQDSCEDCDDTDPLRRTDLEETCWDKVDNNCDDVVDEGCGLDYSGTFRLNRRVTYQCAAGAIDIDFEDVTVLWLPPYASLLQEGGVQPGNMNGTIDEDGTFTFNAANIIGTAAACDELYQFRGVFVDEDTFEGELEARFLGGFPCLNCESQLWTGLTGTRTSQ